MGNIKVNSFIQRFFSDGHKIKILSSVNIVEFISRLGLYSAAKRLISRFFR